MENPVLFITLFGLFLRVASNLTGYLCTGSNGDNLHLKCIETPCNGSDCQTIVKYLDEAGPDITVDESNKVVVNLEIEKISDIHVFYIRQVRMSTDLNNTMRRLLKPIVLKVQLNKPGHIYHLKWINFVNGKPTEEVINNENRENYFGCNAGKDNPTCGTQFYGLSDPLPFTEGFCCSCSDAVNLSRQPRQLSSVHDVSDMKEICNTRKDVQPRGGQHCKNISARPGYTDPQTYYESSHCFRYSDLWYNVYEIEDPQVCLPIALNLYEKNERNNWVSKDALSKYTPKKQVIDSQPINMANVLVLIPQDVPMFYQKGLPKLDASANKLLVVDRSDFTPTGNECNKIGVTQQAFYEQPDRCYKPRGSCLNGQPIDLWLESDSDRLSGRTARHFIERYLGDSVNFDKDRMTIDNFPVQGNQELSIQGVGEIDLNVNTVIQNKAQVQISEIFVTSSSILNKMRIRLSLTNLGLVSSTVSVNLLYWDKRYRKATIHPQQTAEFMLDSRTCPEDFSGGVVQLFDKAMNKLASRVFIAIPDSRCYCLWHWQCKCFHGDDGAKVYKKKSATFLDQKEYTEAGFLGDVPVTAFNEIIVQQHHKIVISLVVFGVYAAFAFLLGFLKAISPYKSHWLWVVYSNGVWLHEFRCYKEEQLIGCKVQQDSKGYVVHPFTKSRNIRLFDKSKEFAINIIFFYSLPVWLCLYLIMQPKIVPYCLLNDTRRSTKPPLHCTFNMRSSGFNSSKTKNQPHTR